MHSLAGMLVLSIWSTGVFILQIPNQTMELGKSPLAHTPSLLWDSALFINLKLDSMSSILVLFCGVYVCIFAVTGIEPRSSYMPVFYHT